MKILRKTAKVLAWIVGSVFALFLLVFLLIQVPAIQNFLKDKAVAYLQDKIKTRVRIGHFSLAFPKKIVLEDILLEDRKKATLLSGERIAVDVDLFKLFQKAVVIKNLELEGIKANIYRKAPDTAFNYQYIVDAFASPTTTPKDTSGGMRFELDKLLLRRITARYTDDQSGMDLYASLGKFNLHTKTFDLDKMRFSVPNIGLENTRIVIRQSKSLIDAPKPMAVHEAESNTPINLALQLRDIDLKQIVFDYENSVQDISAKLQIGAFGTRVDSLNLAQLHVGLAGLHLSNTKGVIRFGPKPPAQMVAEESGKAIAATADNPWKFLIGKLGLTNVDLKFDNDGERRAPSGMDYAHLDVNGLLLDGDHLILTPTRYEGRIDRLEMAENNSRFRLHNLRTDFVYNDAGIALNDLYLETDKTLLRDRIELGWPSLDALTKNPAVLVMSVNLHNSRLSVPDVLTFVPTLRDVPPFQKAPRALYTINDLNLAGPLSALRFNAVDISGLQDMRVRLTGIIRGMPDPAKMAFDLKIAQFQSTDKDLLSFLPPNTLPNTIRLPERFAMTGTFGGKIADFQSGFNLTTSRGNTRGTLAMRNNGEGGYRIDAVTDGLDVGFLTKQEKTVGKVSAKVVATGAGFDPKKGNAVFSAQVYNAGFNGYNYHGIDVSGTLKGGVAQVQGISRDPNVATTFTLSADLRGKSPALAGKVNLTTLDLQALKFSPTPFKVEGKIAADFASLDPDNPIGNVTVRGASFNVNGQKFSTDSLDLAMVQTPDSGYRITLQSDALVAKMQGNFALTQIGPAVMSLIDQYYHLPGTKSAVTRPQDFVLSATVLPSPLLFGFVPQMKASEPIEVYTAFNSTASLLDARVFSPRIFFDKNRIDTLNLTVTTKDPTALRYALQTNGIHAMPLHIYKTTLGGEVANNVVRFTLNNKDIADENRYRLSGNLAAVGTTDAYRLSLAKDSLLLNYKLWTVPDSNYLEYSPQGLVAKDFAFISGAQSFGAYSATLSPKAPLELRFREFQISTLTDFIGQDSLTLNGRINGYAEVQNLFEKKPSFSSDLRIDSISYNNDTIGTILVQADNSGDDAISANVSLAGYGNDMRLNGVYYIAGEKVDMNLNIGNINLQRLPALTLGQVEEGGGSLKGNIDVNGTFAQPNVNGSLHFDSAFFTPSLLGARLYVPADNIFISPQGIRFNNFTMLDSARRRAVIDGDVLTSDFKKYRFGLHITADSFLIANAKRKPGSDQPFFGRLNISTDTRISGTLTAPDVSGRVRVNEGTDFKILMPTSNPEIDAGVGVVRFIDKKNPVNAEIINQEFDTLTARTEVGGVNADLTVQTDSAARFTVVIDERNGDALSVRGVSNLGVGLDRSGKISLTGAYQLQQGSYLMTLNFLRRQFSIKPGSTITWTGEPTAAMVDITATYTALTSPIDLVVDQLAGSAQNELNRYKQQLPFEVQLKMSGQLMKPVISFDVQLPDRLSSQWDVVKARLDQLRSNESELNKQVFALLLLNRFVSETPLKDYGDQGNFAESYIRQSASRLLTDQINRLAGSLIKGVDLNVGVNSSQDYSTGQAAQRTDVSVGLSKRLLNDRLRVNVGSNFMVQGPQQSNQSSNQIAGDVSVEYQITKDGRYQLRTYRRNQYTDVVVGQVVETGAGLGVSVSYDKFKEIFQSAEKTRQLRFQKRADARGATP